METNLFYFRKERIYTLILNCLSLCLITSLFQDVKLRDTTGLVKGLPLKFQQSAFENLYIKVQEGAKTLVIIITKHAWRFQVWASPSLIDPRVSIWKEFVKTVSMALRSAFPSGISLLIFSACSVIFMPMFPVQSPTSLSSYCPSVLISSCVFSVSLPPFFSLLCPDSYPTFSTYTSLPTEVQVFVPLKYFLTSPNPLPYLLSNLLLPTHPQWYFPLFVSS